MTTTPAPTTGTGLADSAARVLGEVADVLDLAIYAEARQLELALDWAALHPGDQVDYSVPYGDRDLQIAGDGAPTVAEFAIADFALALGLSTDAGRNLIGDAVELHHRLPLLWDQAMSGRVRAWKARKIAQATRALPLDAAAYVDRQLAAVAHRCSYAQIERTVERAKAEYDPDTLEAERLRHTEERYFRIRTGEVTTDGRVYIDGLVDLPAALALDKAVAVKAHDLLTEHPDLDLDQRRALAVGHLGDQTANTPEVVLYTHTRPGQALVEIDNTHSVITPGELVDWCRLTGARVTVKPVTDLAAELHTDAYQPTPAQIEQANLTNPTCVFPRCTRPSTSCDTDHIVPWPLGPTTSTNLAPLCRGHHRLKTHGNWTYTRTSPTSFIWTSPTRQQHPSGRHPR